MATMRDFLHSLPKAELHVHLEGSLDCATLMELNPALSAADVERRYRCSGFEEFIKSFVWASGFLNSPDAYALAARRLLDRLEAQEVRYAEITLSAGVALWRGLDLAQIHDAVRAASADSSVENYWIWDAIRQFGPGPAAQVVEMAAERACDGVIAFGLGGDESRGPVSGFRELFERARRMGLRLVCHAGETEGPESVRQAIDAGAERIGHGIGAASDPGLVRLLAAQRIPLEICISSNRCTGASARFAIFPLRQLFDAGVPVILNTDDPPMFHTTLCGEYEIAAREFGFSKAELRRLAGNSFRYAFGWNRPFPDGLPA